MIKTPYRSMGSNWAMKRRKFLKVSGGTGLVLGTPMLWATEAKKRVPPPKPETNVKEALKVPRTRYSLPGLFPGRVVETHHPEAVKDKQIQADAVSRMFARGMEKLTGKSLKKSFSLFFNRQDVVGIKVNPVGPGLISTRLEVVDAIIAWLRQGGIPAQHIIIWDRFDYMLKDAGFIPKRFPGIGIEGLQTMDEEAAEGKTKDNSRWLDPSGKHLSLGNFDQNVYYWADVEGPKEMPYLNQHVVNGKHSYFGNLLTQKLTKIINVPVFKNTGNGISMATKNIGYGAICNTGRLHKPLFFNVCTEVLAFPVIRDKMVLNITDGLVAQYEGGPMPVPKYTYPYNRLFFATDPFALDMICHHLIVQKRKEMGVKVNEHPIYTEYLRYAQKLGLGQTDPEKMEHKKEELG
jgi:hypothetical protein